jgi:DNA-binding transcriptional MerR regulator
MLCLPTTGNAQDNSPATTAPADASATSSDWQATGVPGDDIQAAYARLHARQAIAATQPESPEKQNAELRKIIAMLREQISELKQDNLDLQRALRAAQLAAPQPPPATPPAAQQQSVPDGDLVIGMTLDQATQSTHAVRVQMISEDADGTKVYRWLKTGGGSGPILANMGFVTATFQNNQLVSYQNDSRD